MAARKSSASNSHLEEAMALLIRNQAAFVEQFARNDQERLMLQRNSDERQLRNEEWQPKSDERFDRIEANILQLPKTILRTILDQMPAIKKEIGFKTQK